MESEKVFHILHFNDVYNLESRKKEPVGGAARFIAAARKYQEHNPLVLFSGDIYSPCKLGQTLKGKQMLPFFENFKIDVACLGNHDLDYGVERFLNLKKYNTFPWLCTNVISTHTGKPLADTLDHVILEHAGVKIGIIGLAEEEWLGSIVGLEETDYEYEDFIKSGKKWCQKLREEGCEIIIALTHMRMPNDKKLTQKVDDLDLVLGGHDHCTACVNINDTMLCKSGTDFREFSIIKIRTNCSEEALNNESHDSVINFKKRLIMTWEKVNITSEIEPDPIMQSIVDDFWKDLEVKMKYPAGYTEIPMDARFDVIRCKESNVSNFIADVVRYAYGTDTCIINSGCLRTDEIIPKGIFRWKDIDTLLPIPKECVVIRVKGSNLLQALENGISEVPKLEGRFPCISGIRVKYDTSKPGGERILECTVNGEPLNKAKLYTLATLNFMYNGKDGYEALSEGELVTDEEDGVTINNALINFLKQMIRGNNKWFLEKKRVVKELLKIAYNEDYEFVTHDDDGDKLRYEFYKIYPQVDGRLTDVNAENMTDYA